MNLNKIGICLTKQQIHIQSVQPGIRSTISGMSQISLSFHYSALHVLTFILIFAASWLQDGSIIPTHHILLGRTKVVKPRPIIRRSSAHHLKLFCNSSWKVSSETLISHVKETSFFIYSELIKYFSSTAHFRQCATCADSKSKQTWPFLSMP